MRIAGPGPRGRLLQLAGLCALSGLLRAEPLKMEALSHVPRPFTDDLLPESQRTGELVPHLGRVQLLDTFMRPKSIDEIQTSFSIYNNQHAPQRLVMRPDSWTALGRTIFESYGPYHFDLDQLAESGFDAAQRTVVMIPGYMSPESAEWVRAARLRWLELDRRVNVIEVSWSDSNQGTYSSAAAHTVLVARQVTILLHYLAELSGGRLQDERFLARLHLIGHSLGAHIAGFVGQDLDGRLGRITGLDPAGPSFDQFSSQQRLDRDDARLVEVLHTNSGRMKYLKLLASAPLQALAKLTSASSFQANDATWFGIDQRIGHLDYYANDGRLQAGCQGVWHICDHLRARDIYVDLLDYECTLRRSKSARSLVALLERRQAGLTEAAEALQPARLGRLYAFKSADYEEFASGRSFAASCPELMAVSRHLDDAQALRNFRNCSVPLLDLLKPTEELIEELASQYGIHFGPASWQQRQQQQRHAYYFRTSADTGKLVGDHYLLKVYLREGPLWGPGECSLQARAVLRDGDQISMELGQLGARLEAGQRLLALPFVHRDSSKLLKLVSLLDGANGLAGANASLGRPPNGPAREFLDAFQELFPRTISLSLVEPNEPGVLGSMKSATISMMRGGEEREPTRCRLTIDMIEVHPIVYGLRRNFGALYGRDLFLEGAPGSGPGLAVLEAADLPGRLGGPQRLDTTLSADSFSSFGVGLEAALIG